MWLKLPKLGRKAMLGMLEGPDVARLDTTMVTREGRHALLEAYEKKEVFGTEFTYRLPKESNGEDDHHTMLHKLRYQCI